MRPFFNPPAPLCLVFLNVNLMGIPTFLYCKPVCHLNLTEPPNFTGKQLIPDKACDVHINKGSHQVLTVKAIHDTSMPWDCVGEILNKTERITLKFQMLGNCTCLRTSRHYTHILALICPRRQKLEILLDLSLVFKSFSFMKATSA